jgi:transposase
VIDEYWSGEIAGLLRAAPRLLATSVFELIKAQGYSGSYVSVARHLNTVRGPRFTAAPAASTRIVTAPGEEAQFDWSDVSQWTREWGMGEVQCFSAILSFSRVRIWWFARSVDREHTFEGLIRFFEFVGGVPKVLRTDRMGALGTSQGRRFRLHPPAHGFAQFCGTEIRACQARDAKRKGKVERPFRDVKERFLEECSATGAPTSLAELNERAARWLEVRVHARLHRGTGAIPAERLVAEVPVLGALPRRRFDTAYVEARRVHVAIPQIEWRGVRYSVPPRCLGQRVEVRQEVEGSSIEIRWAGEHVATHAISDIEGMEVWDALHFQEAQSAALSRSRGRHLSIVVPDDLPTTLPLRLDIAGDVEVDVPDLARYETDGARS